MDPQPVHEESPAEPVAPPPRRRFPSWLPQVLGYSLSAACLIYVLHDYDTSRLIPAIRSLDWRWVLLGVVADLATYVAHAWRWNTLLGPVARLRLWRTTQAIYIGLFANEVLPLRTGEVIRIYLLAHWNNLRLSVGLASATVERIFDGFWMILAFVVTASFVKTIPKEVVFVVQALGVLIVIGMLAMVWVVRRKSDAGPVLTESKWAMTIRHVVEGLQLMGNARTMMGTGVVSLVYLVLQIVTYFALMKAYGLDLSFWVAGGVLTIVRFGVVVPNAPGNLGLFQFWCLKALTLFEVAENDAKDFSFVLFVALTLPLLIGGAVATALTGLKLGELRDRAKRGAEAVGG